jgi:hypothetical protein
MSGPPSTEVLLFNTCAASHLAARVHSPACQMVVSASRARPGARSVVVIRDEPAGHLAEEIADLSERGWAVKRCKCLGTAK